MHVRFRTILLIALLACASAFADTLWVGSGAASNALPIKNVTVTGISNDGKLLFQSAGRDATRDLATVARIQIDDEPIFSGAEEAFAAGKFDLAAKGYLAALYTTRKPWLTPRLATRLTESAQKGIRPDANAIAQATAALTREQLFPQQRQALQSFLGSQGPADAPKATPPAAPANPISAGGSAIAKQKLDAAVAALKAGDFAAAINQISSSRAAFTDASTQSQALFCLAQAQAGLATGKNDPAAWQDAALAYMRLVAHFPDSPLAPAALLKTAEIERDKLSDPAAARSVYQQVASQYPNDPSAAEAAKQLQQLDNRR